MSWDNLLRLEKLGPVSFLTSRIAVLKEPHIIHHFVWKKNYGLLMLSCPFTNREKHLDWSIKILH